MVMPPVVQRQPQPTRYTQYDEQFGHVKVHHTNSFSDSEYTPLEPLVQSFGWVYQSKDSLKDCALPEMGTKYPFLARKLLIFGKEWVFSSRLHQLTGAQ